LFCLSSLFVVPPPWKAIHSGPGCSFFPSCSLPYNLLFSGDSISIVYFDIFSPRTLFPCPVGRWFFLEIGSALSQGTSPHLIIYLRLGFFYSPYTPPTRMFYSRRRSPLSVFCLLFPSTHFYFLSKVISFFLSRILFSKFWVAVMSQ